MSAEEPTRRPFRAIDVLSGSIDRKPAARPARTRKQISAQLEPAQVRVLGELHARLNADAQTRIEKSELVGLGIEVLDALLEPAGGATHELHDIDELRAYVRTRIRGLTG